MEIDSHSKKGQLLEASLLVCAYAEPAVVAERYPVQPRTFCVV